MLEIDGIKHLRAKAKKGSNMELRKMLNDIYTAGVAKGLEIASKRINEAFDAHDKPVTGDNDGGIGVQPDSDVPEGGEGSSPDDADRREGSV